MINTKQWPWAVWVAMCMALALAASPAAAQAKQVAVPAFSARVLDLTGTLDEGQKEELREKIASLEENTGAVLAVLMLQTTGEDTIEQYATRVFDAWKPGNAEKDNGLLVVIALKDRRMRIEVGQGLEGTVPDILAGRIIDQDMKPRFRGEDYAGGIEAAINSLEALLRGEAPAVSRQAAEPRTVRDVIQESAPLLWGLGLTALGGLGLGALRARGRMPWPLLLVLLPAGPAAAGMVLGKPAVAAAAMAATAAAYGIGLCVVRLRWVRWLVAGILLLLGALLAIASVTGADEFWTLFPVLVPAGIGCLLLVLVALNMWDVWQQNRREFCVRAGLVLAVSGYALLENMPDGSWESWMPAAAAAGASLLFCCLPSGGGASGGSGRRGSSGGGYSGRSSSSGSSSSSSGGSSSGGGASGSW